MSDLQRLWFPRGVAVIGASGRPGSMGEAPVRYLREHGFQGGVYPVNPNYDQVQGYPCYPSVAACPGPVDLALVMVGAERVQAALEDCAANGVSFAVVLSSGFAESGEEGARLQREMIAAAGARGLRVIGPNCIGLVNPHARLVAGFSPLFSRAAFKPGEIGLVSQSGALGYGIASLALDLGLGFSRIINTGNEAGFTTAEVVRDLLLDDVTRVVLVYSEGLQRPEDWPELARLSMERGKPIVMLKVGRSEAGSRAAASHTAALAGDDAIYDVALRQLGTLRAGDIGELLDLGSAFRQPRLPAGNRVGVLTTSGGAGIMAADACADRRLAIPELAGESRALLENCIPSFGSAANPVDVTAQVLADRAVFRRCLRQLAQDPAIDMIIACFCVLTGESADRTVADVLAVAAETDKPILLSKTGGDSLAPEARGRLLGGGIPVFDTPARAARAGAAMRRFASARRHIDQVARVAEAVRRRTGSPPAPGPALTERDTKALLAAHGLPVTREILATTAEEAVAAAESIGYPVVLKVESPDILHKTEAGGVALGLRDAARVAAPSARCSRSRPGASWWKCCRMPPCA